MTDRYTLNGDTFVKCSCTHMTSFALLMDATDQEVNYVWYHKDIEYKTRNSYTDIVEPDETC